MRSPAQGTAKREAVSLQNIRSFNDIKPKFNPNKISMPKMNTEALKEILASIHDSEALASHSWTESLFVRAFADNHPNLNAGSQLLLAIGELFREMMPPSPTKRGVRLDARWSEFGFLAAKYFAPILRGTPVPASFQDVSKKIDESILFFVYGDENTRELSEEEIESYVLIGDEYKNVPASTLSDWHRKGLGRLLGIIQAREEHLALSVADNSGQPEEKPLLDAQKGNRKRVLWALLGIIIIGFLIAGGRKVFRIYERGMPVFQDLILLKEIMDSSPELDELKEAGPVFETLQDGLDVFRQEVEPLLWITPYLGWVPEYGCELTSSQSMLDLATSLTDLGVEGYQASLPFMGVYEANTSDLNLAALTELLVQAQPQFSKAQDSFGAAQMAREDIDNACLSPYIHNLLINKIDPLLILMGDALTVATELPRLLGSTSEGPKTYLLLVQNEDELRPTGGFITAAGSLLLENGQISGMNFEDSGELDNWDKPYPVAPWQLRQYMNSPVLVFRDANWSPDFPTSALYAEHLYSYVRNHSVDGVIAFDQQMLVEILSALGPIELENAPYPIGPDNIISYMRSEKIRGEEDLDNPDWDNKDFINDIFVVLLTKIFGGDVQWEILVDVLSNTLDEHHLLLQLDNPAMTSLLARQGWDGAVRAGNGDFLMVVDSNIGFNKTNAVIQTSLSYAVDLTDLTRPESNLTVFHQNNSDHKVPCVQYGGITLEGQEEYPIDRCYWDYMRIYTVAGTSLQEANPQAIPADWMIRRQAVPAQVDVLEEEIDGVQGFGVLKVVPGGQSVATNFEFILPSHIIETQRDSRNFVYSLRIQKQPGTLAVPVTIRVHLPNNANIQSVPSEAVIQGSNILIETSLKVDREIEIVFDIP